MYRLIILIVFSFPTLSLAQRNKDSLNSLDLLKNRVSQLEGLNDKLVAINERLAFQEKIDSQIAAGISNQLTAANNLLSLFSVIFAVSAILIGVHVSKIERRVSAMHRRNELLLSQTESIGKDTSKLNDKIQNDISGLYKQLKREETVGFLDRMIKIPGEINNLKDFLFSRELLPEDFLKLKDAFLLHQAENGIMSDYQLLMIQHFYKQALKDKDIRLALKGKLLVNFNFLYEHEAINVSRSIAELVKENSASEYQDEIKDLFVGLSLRKKFASPVASAMFAELKQYFKQVELFESIPDHESALYAKVRYGYLLVHSFNKLAPSEEQVRITNHFKILSDKLDDIENEAAKKNS